MRGTTRNCSQGWRATPACPKAPSALRASTPVTSTAPSRPSLAGGGCPRPSDPPEKETPPSLFWAGACDSQGEGRGRWEENAPWCPEDFNHSAKVRGAHLELPQKNPRDGGIGKVQMDPLVTVKNQRTHLNAFFTFILIMKGRSPSPSAVSLQCPCHPWGRARAGAALLGGHSCPGGVVWVSQPCFPSFPELPLPPVTVRNFIYSVC